MPPIYQQMAGRSLERLAALSDGVFAIAMTLIVLELKVPPHTVVHSEANLLSALGDLASHIAAYAMSFITLAIFWSGQQAQLNSLGTSDRKLSMLHLAFLAAVATMPFSTALLGEYINYRTALLVYWFNLLMLGVTLYGAWRYARRAALVKGDLPTEMDRAIERRVIHAQALYAIGAAMCVFNTYVSIAFIVLVQTLYAIAPRAVWINRLLG
jgi:uncharacterized membrane protein